MKISIITAVLNGSGTLEETILSVRTQDHDEVEHVVVDGGSTDGSLEIIRRYEGSIGPWVSEPDGGIGEAFNRGIRMATGEVIGIISADDYLWPGALARVSSAFQENPDADVVYGNAVYLEEDGRRIVSRPDVNLHTLRYRMSLRHAAVFVRRSAYERFGAFDPTYRLAMDYELMLRFAKQAARFVYVDQPLAAIRTGGVSAQRFLSTIAEVRDISVGYGFPAIPAYVISGRDIAHTLLKRSLEAGRLRWVIEAYRAISPRFRKVAQNRTPHDPD